MIHRDKQGFRFKNEHGEKIFLFDSQEVHKSPLFCTGLRVGRPRFFRLPGRTLISRRLGPSALRIACNVLVISSGVDAVKAYRGRTVQKRWSKLLSTKGIIANEKLKIGKLLVLVKRELN